MRLRGDRVLMLVSSVIPKASKQWEGGLTMKHFVWFMLFCGSCWAQQDESSPAPTNIPGAEFPRLQSDLSATFRVQADNAQKVQLLMELGQSTYDMTKRADGFWEVTTKPLLPGFHYYLISVDGFASTDPGSRTFFAARKEVSGLEVQASESEFFAIN